MRTENNTERLYLLDNKQQKLHNNYNHAAQYKKAHKSKTPKSRDDDSNIIQVVAKDRLSIKFLTVYRRLHFLQWANEVR